MQKIFFISMLALAVMVLILITFTPAFANGEEHEPGEEHDEPARVDRSGQMMPAFMGFVIGLIIGGVSVKFIFVK